MSESRKAKFLLNAQEKFGDQYDYSRIEYVNGSVPITFTCRGCGGELTLTPTKHLQGQRCNVCRPSKTGKKTTEWFLEQVGEYHSEYDYDYSKVNYVNSTTKVEIFCRTHQQTFFAPPQDFLVGKNRCRECGEEARLEKRRLPFEEWLPRAQAVHGGLYEYDAYSWNGLHKPVRIRCAAHGWFEQIPANHETQGSGCPKCGRDLSRLGRRIPEAELISRAREAHGDTYTYPDQSDRPGKYISACCSKHGVFQQLLVSHLKGRGCMKCSIGRVSSGQQEIFDFLKESYTEEIMLEHRMSSGLILDIFLPKLHVGIEYNGLYYHSEPSRLDRSKPAGRSDYKYHYEKSLQANRDGIALIHIWEDEWLFKQDLVKALLLNRLNLDTQPRVFAQNTQIVEVSADQAYAFFEATHLQGLRHTCSRYIGLATPDTGLVALAAFSERGSASELVGFSTSCPVPEGFSRILSSYRQSCPSEISEIVAFSDTRLSEGGLYQAAGFDRVGEVDVSYEYIQGRERRPKSEFQLSALENDFQKFDPNLSERDNCELNGWFRLWDCGKVKWVLKR